MKNIQPILKVKITPNKALEIDLKQYMPLGKIRHKNIIKTEFFHIDSWKSLDDPSDFKDQTARLIRFTAKKEDSIEIYPGTGYVAKKDETWRKPFIRYSGWTGGDGIFSFNIKNGRDTYDQKDAQTIFVFGDTLIGKSDPRTKKRFPPLLMPANTIAYLKGNGDNHKDIEFNINTNSHNNVIPYFSPENAMVYEGTVAQNLVNYTVDDHQGYLSGYHPEKVELLFDLNQNQHISTIDIYNYRPYPLADESMLNRGVKKIAISVSLDQDKWLSLGEFSLEKATNADKPNVIPVHKPCRYVKMHVPAKQGTGNHYDANDTAEVIFGLQKTVFYTNDNQQLCDIAVEATSELSREKKHAWFWLQDGVVIDDAIYFLPLIITPDPDKPEGLQFAVEGVSMIKSPIKNGKVDFEHHQQKPTCLYRGKKNDEWVFGAAIMNNSKASGHINADGYIYIYGYNTINGERTLKVARVKPEQFETLDAWRFYSDGAWVSSLEEASSILKHISCEMSVSPIETGANKGKYLAVFQYNVDSKYVAYAIGDTPAGPFSEPRIVYECEEPVSLGRTAYTYNAKAHPHLSKPDDILVTYNVNTYDMQHHLDNVEVYHPRFLRLKDTSIHTIDKRGDTGADEPN